MTVYCSPLTKARLLSTDSLTRRGRSSDDEGSITSTFTVDQTDKQQLPTQCPVVEPQRHRVMFDESRNVVRTTPADDCCLEERWITSAEMKQMKNKTIYLAKEINRSDKANTTQNSFSYPRVVMGVYLSCSGVALETDQSPLTAVQRKQFYKWMDAAQSRLGLERACIQELRLDKYRRRTQVVDAVMGVQECLPMVVIRDDSDELIREASQSVSRASRIFAHELAVAQAASLQM